MGVDAGCSSLAVAARRSRGCALTPDGAGEASIATLDAERTAVNMPIPQGAIVSPASVLPRVTGLRPSEARIVAAMRGCGIDGDPGGLQQARLAFSIA